MNKYNIRNKIKEILKEEKGQISLEFIIILGVVILVALTVGIFLKQTSAKNVDKVTETKRIFENN
jgi:uncharacterized protein (UPF0333 family)